MCFGSSYRAIFRLSSKKGYIQLAMLYRVRDIVLHAINIYYCVLYYALIHILLKFNDSKDCKSGKNFLN